MTRQAGILAPVFSLPGRHGIGDFGECAYQFIDGMQDAGFRLWQILPLNPVGYGNSPYQPYSSYAGDEIYISLETLQKEGFIKHIRRYGAACDHVDYERSRTFKTVYLKEAYQTFCDNDFLHEEYEQFVNEHQWAVDYAEFIALKKSNALVCWNEWPKKYRDYGRDQRADITQYADDIAYELFLQFIFYRQWFALKTYASEHGVQIMGDIPIYVGIDSSDVWKHRDMFLLDKDGHPRFIAGVPPDYFSATGQRWGNPIYDWKHLQKTKFNFWIERLRWNARMYDIIRIDHFRAFDTYWKIPASCPTAEEGAWVEACGYELFDEIYDQLPTIQLVAEDLGDLRPEVLELRDYYKLSGMKIVQFELDPNENNNNFTETKQTIVYSGTHDNQTLKGWYQALTPYQRKKIAAQFPKRHYRSVTQRIMASCFHSVADTVIIPIQDIMQLDDQSRINTPGTIGSPNWEWKLKQLKPAIACMQSYRELIQKSQRLSWRENL